MQISSKRIGEILVEKGLISNQQLQAVLEEQKKSRGYLGNILIDKGWISKREFLETLAEQYNIPLVDLKNEKIDMELARRLPAAIFQQHNCFPLRRDDESVTVVISNPLDVTGISKLEQEFKPLKLKLVLSPEENVKQVIQNYRRSVSEGIQRLLKGDKNS